MMVVVALMGVLIWAAYKGRISESVYKAARCVLLFVFWFVNDVIDPIVTKAFHDRTPEQIQAYRIYALLNLAGYAGLAFFAMSLGGNSGLYGALAFAAAMMYKRRYLNRFLGVEEEEENGSEQEETPEEPSGQEAAVLEAAEEEPSAEKTPAAEER